MHVQPFLTNEALCKELSKYGSIQTQMRTELLYLPSGRATTIKSFTRTVGMSFRRDQILPPKLNLEFEKELYVVTTQVGRKKCFICRSTSHVSKDCPEKDKNDVNTTNNNGIDATATFNMQTPSYAVVASGSNVVTVSSQLKRQKPNRRKTDTDANDTNTTTQSPIGPIFDNLTNSNSNSPVSKRTLEISPTFSLKWNKKMSRDSPAICEVNPSWNFGEWKDWNFCKGKAPMSPSELLIILQDYDQNQNVSVSCDRNQFKELLLELKPLLREASLKQKISEIIQSIPPI
ncbi:unnamed protein product [Allacma fusca]|uniref:CCHC-type domain-containing protein n=1 Tax=Allacma fusca TaxID=39272 RepID=A0A8J2P7V4_9HEXA|nr:unnamed protein product [Allacma fusca]